MKKLLIGFVLEAVYDALLLSMAKLVARSSSKVDDKVLDLFKKERSSIIKEIKHSI